jgi:hypothetical protein
MSLRSYDFIQRPDPVKWDPAFYPAHRDKRTACKMGLFQMADDRVGE